MHILKKGYEESKVIPIDNYLRRMSKQGKLMIATTLPFLTSVQLWSIGASTIQNRDEDKIDGRYAITRTQVYNTYLRRMLSVYKDKVDIIKMWELVGDMIENDQIKRDELKNRILETLNSFLLEEKVLVYRREKRLDNDGNLEA